MHVHPWLRFLLRRLAAIPITLILITAALYGIVMLTPAEERAKLYMPRGSSNNPARTDDVLIQRVIDQHGLSDPYPVQYIRWLARLLRGDWDWSPTLRADVLESLLVRTPSTAELTLFSMLSLIPLGVVGGVIAAWRQGRLPDLGFRSLAFLATSIPPFIMGLVLLSIFYAGLRWFPPGRLSVSEQLLVHSEAFTAHTGLLTIDGLLNGRLDISISALRHMILPGITLGLLHWATLGRVTRAAVIEEVGNDYVVAAKGRGLSQRRVIWFHVFRNALVPVLNSAALSAASLVMGVFVIEVVFGFPGVSELITLSLGYSPDTPLAMGFAIYSVVLILPLMLVFDVFQGVIDPRVRAGVV